MFRTLSRLFRLKPYDNHLIDGMAEVWLFLAALNVAAIALCDAIAWAYFGYTTARGAAAYVSAAIAFVIVLTLVGSLDAMFVMHDRTRSRRDEPRRLLHRENLALAARVVLVILTFTVTAPFLTQLFFARDIEASIRRRNEASVAGRREQISSAYDARLDAARSALAGRQRDLENEIAGRGASGRYGKGVTASAIEREIAALESNISSLQTSRAAELRTFDASSGDAEALASRFGVDLVREGPDTRARVVAELAKSPSFRNTGLAIKAFLVFMFLGLICLKLFQPESVRIYYSARLQSAHARLKAGLFSHWLDPREQTMTPLRFAEWYDNDQQTRDVTDRLRDRSALALERLRAQEEAVRTLQDALRADVVRLNDELAAAAKRGDEIEEAIAQCSHELEVLNARIAEEQQQVDDFTYDDGEELSLRDQQLLIASRNRTVRQLADHRAAAVRLSATVKRLTQRLDASRSLERNTREAMTAASDESASLGKALQEARQRRLSDILAAD